MIIIKHLHAKYYTEGTAWFRFLLLRTYNQRQSGDNPIWVMEERHE